MGLIEELGEGPVGLDTSILIYYVEEHPTYVTLVDPVFESMAGGGLEAVTSELTLLEVLVVPYRTGDLSLAKKYEALLTRGRGLQLVGVDRSQLRTAAKLRARYGVRTPDALQLAAALSAGCTAFLTNDRRLPSIGGVKVVTLSAAV